MLPRAQYWYNTSIYSTIKMTPYKTLYGRDPPSLPETTKIHNVFHISMLKRFRGNQQNPYLPLPLQTT